MTTNDNDNDTNNRVSNRQVGGAAVAGGIVGLALFGPITAVVGAIGGAVAAQSRGKPGEVARSVGETTATVGDRLKEFNEDHQVVDKTKRAAGGLIRSAQRFDEEHHVVEKASNSIVAGADYVSRKLSPSTSEGRNRRDPDRGATV